MQVQVNTDRHVNGSVALAERVRATVESTLARFSDRITRVEVHLSDENSATKGGFDMRCVMEARVNGRPPTAVTATAPTLDEAIAGAVERLERAIGNMLGRLNDR
jgi:ribosome-associated translation inhibitor RaiA